MLNKAKLPTKMMTMLFVLILSVTMLCSMPAVKADDISSEAQQVLDLIDKLPKDTKMVTIENKTDIVAAKVAYNALTPEQKMEILTDKLVILNSNYSAVMPFVLANLVKEVKEMPTADKIKAEQKEKVISLYEDYGILDETAKAAFAKAHKEKLFSAVSKLSPETLTEEDKKLVSESNPEETNTENKKESKKANFSTIWQWAVIALVSLVVSLGFAAMIVILIKVIRLSR